MGIGCTLGDGAWEPSWGVVSTLGCVAGLGVGVGRLVVDTVRGVGVGLGTDVGGEGRGISMVRWSICAMWMKALVNVLPYCVPGSVFGGGRSRCLAFAFPGFGRRIGTCD